MQRRTEGCGQRTAGLMHAGGAGVGLAIFGAILFDAPGAGCIGVTSSSVAFRKYEWEFHHAGLKPWERYKLLTTFLFIRAILTVFLPVTHVAVQHTLDAVLALPRAPSTLEGIRPRPKWGDGRALYLIRAIVAMRAAVTHQFFRHTTPLVLALKIVYEFKFGERRDMTFRSCWIQQLSCGLGWDFTLGWAFYNAKTFIISIRTVPFAITQLTLRQADGCALALHKCFRADGSNRYYGNKKKMSPHVNLHAPSKFDTEWSQ